MNSMIEYTYITLTHRFCDEFIHPCRRKIKNLKLDVKQDQCPPFPILNHSSYLVYNKRVDTSQIFLTIQPTILNEVARYIDRLSTSYAACKISVRVLVESRDAIIGSESISPDRVVAVATSGYHWSLTLR